MTAPLGQMNIFELRPLIRNISCKLSAISSYDGQKQLLCIVSDDNEIVLRYTSATGQEVLKMISWFRRSNRVIHDVSFDPSGLWLLVLCFDNTLHIVPALAIVDKANPLNSTAYPPYSTTQVTSYIIPFVGPHECPNSKNCPNHSTAFDAQTQNTVSELKVVPQLDSLINEAENLEANVANLQSDKEVQDAQLNDIETQQDVASLCHDLPAHMIAKHHETSAVQYQLDATGNSQVMATSFMASKTCPYPLSVVWWKTYDGVNRAIIGYSDGSICFVALSPNCPFVASTAIEGGSVMKLIICKDNTLESVMLLITSSMKQQFKLLLEQKAIMYVYPGDISPTTAAQNREADWQIVMPLHGSKGSAAGAIRKSNSSDPASDSSQLEEDVFLQNDEVASTTTTTGTSMATGATMTQNINDNQLQQQPQQQLPPPPPPPYTTATARSINNTTQQSFGLRFQQQQLPANSFDADGGILPTARARLASLKSLGTKKLQAIKMRLSDNRQRVDEYMPESSLGSFAIMDSPSVTPEPLGDTNGSFYSMQNLRNTYLLSALHTQSHSLTVHSIDINLKPLFSYKIPKHSLDVLICSNLLYSIQYVDINNDGSTTTTATSSMEDAANTEKEMRDTDVEKLEKVSNSDDDGERSNEATTSTSRQARAAKFTNAAAAAASKSQDGTTTTSTDNSDTPSNAINAVSVISSAMASLHTNKDDKFNYFAHLGLFRFENETVLNLYQMATYRNGSSTESEVLTKEEKAKAFEMKDIHTPMDYVQFYENANVETEYSLRQMEIMQTEFPRINYDPCYVVTNKNVYYIQLKKEPFAIFLDAALSNQWMQCHDFCNTFDLSYETCIEFAGDYLLRRKKVTQALLTYNVARVKPIRTALKLAMYGQNYALMQLCALALKSTYVLNSRHLSHPIFKTIMKDVTLRHSEDVRVILPLNASEQKEPVNAGCSCSDYTYGLDESISALQMSPSSQFHLANLLLITLAEKAVNDKFYIPLWNFLVTNSKYHTNMTSIVLCQSGLFSAALILAKIRGVCIDTFLALTSVVAQEFGWYTELNVCLYNLSEELFAETITYLPQVSIDYFVFIQEKLKQIHPCVLSRLAQQLNPFSAVLRPIVSHTSAAWHYRNVEQSSNDNNTFLFEFCKSLIETYIAVLIHMESQRIKRDNIVNALSNFRINYEDNQFAIDSTRFKLISAGCAHCACVVDGVAYFWGSNGVPCCYSANKSSDPPEPPHAVKALELLSQLNLEVHAVKCGRQHSLILTNNGLYAMGNNSLCQLGIGRGMQMALQPMLVRALDGKNITILEAGQYHNAAVADGQLYMWGWGIYGQLGQGSCENITEPKLVSFFKYKKVIQVSLGHAHSLVLCQTTNATEATNTELYVFGSNHFGQLGIGGTESGGHTAINAAMADDFHNTKEVKCILPVKLEVSTSRLRLIHTKFFTNLAVDENECMYTWGSSPQALRLSNQIRRRANAKQKLEESQHREMSKRFEATLTTTNSSTSLIVEPGTTYAAVAASAVTDAAQTKSQLKEQTKESEQEDAASNVEDEAEDDCEDLMTLPKQKSDAQETKEKRTNYNKPKITLTKAPTPPQPPSQPTAEVDPCEHLTPHLVDTTEIAGKILQISSGLFHFALISSSCTLYTWGKNLEHQLGTEDKERRVVNKPSPIDSIDRPMYVDCGADFTLVMTVDYVVKAFGGNSNGQCGRDLGPSIDRMKQRVVCLPTTKRLMRFESQCVEAPVEINLPRPRIRINVEPVRYLKCIPRYKEHFMQEANINFEQTYFERGSNASPQHYKSSSENAITGQESDDLISSLENLSNNDASSLNFSYNAPQALDCLNSSYDCTPEEQSYAPLPELSQCGGGGGGGGVGAQQANANNPNDDDDQSTFTPSVDDEAVQPLRHYIHYCLYAFHGLYNPEKIVEFSKQRVEYRIRTLMLNFKFVDAFKLCLQDCTSAQRTLKIFEYFSKDTGYVPMRRQELKYLIYHLCLHFLERKFDLLECERFFLADLDYYMLELAYVLYFNNNNTVLEQNLNQKFKYLIEQEQQQGSIDNNLQGNPNASASAAAAAATNSNEHSVYKLQETDVIFDAFSVKFKTIVCQRLLKYCGSN